jgi:hypothetical protein
LNIIFTLQDTEQFSFFSGGRKSVHIATHRLRYTACLDMFLNSISDISMLGVFAALDLLLGSHFMLQQLHPSKKLGASSCV